MRQSAAALAVVLISVSVAIGADRLFDSEAKRVIEMGAGEGPAWNPELGLLFSGSEGIGRLDRSGTVSLFRPDAGTNGLLYDYEGRLLSCVPAKRLVSRMKRDGTMETLAETFDGMRFNQPNDITVDTRSRIYFTDPQYGDRSAMEMKDDAGRLVEGVYRIDPDGTVSRVITHEVDRPNGIVVTPDDKFLYVADNNNERGGARKLWRFALKKNGDVENLVG